MYLGHRYIDMSQSMALSLKNATSGGVKVPLYTVTNGHLSKSWARMQSIDVFEKYSQITNPRCYTQANMKIGMVVLRI